jgi:hypothetical protein
MGFAFFSLVISIINSHFFAYKVALFFSDVVAAVDLI